MLVAIMVAMIVAIMVIIFVVIMTFVVAVLFMMMIAVMFMVVIVFDAVDVPNALIRCQDQAIDDGSRGLQNANRFKRSVIVALVRAVFLLKSVAPYELLAKLGSCLSGYICAKHHFKRRLKAAALRECCGVKVNKGLIRTNDPKAFEIVTKRQRHRARDRGIAPQQSKA